MRYMWSQKKEGLDLHVDHIKPKDLDGKATIDIKYELRLWCPVTSPCLNQLP